MFQQANILKNYGIQLQEMGIKMTNFGMQMTNMMLNIGNEIQKMGLQISNIGMQIFNMGVQMLSENFNVRNIFEQNQFMGVMNQNMNMSNQIEPIGIKTINNNDNSKTKINFCFKTDNGLKTLIFLEEDKTMEELLKLFLIKIGLEYNAFDIEHVRFEFNGQLIKSQDKSTKIKDFFQSYGSIIYSTLPIRVHGHL